MPVIIVFADVLSSSSGKDSPVTVRAEMLGRVSLVFTVTIFD